MKKKNVKYVFDKTVSFFSLIILFPVLFTIAIMILIKMPEGSVFFKQKRVGQYGRYFWIYKFRTMTISHYDSTISVAGENRITALGRVLRKYKLDELPELWNVLKGDMSLVGPRPDVSGYADKLDGNDRKILKLRPGITGPASLKYRKEEELLASVDDPIAYNNKIIFPDKVKINLNYLNNWSFGKDMKIIIYTLLSKDLENYYN